MSVGAALRNPDNVGNKEEIELQWAMKAFAHAETYFNLISSVDPSVLKLTKNDDFIYQSFRDEFPDFKIDVIEESSLKSPEGKEAWRPFCESMKGKIEDYNFGTLLRTDCKGDYTEANTLLVLRAQFLAIEIARNREGYNNPVRSIHGKKSSDENKSTS